MTSYINPWPFKLPKDIRKIAFPLDMRLFAEIFIDHIKVARK